MNPKFPSAISTFGATAKQKLSNPAISGQAEDQLRAPIEQLIGDLAELCGFVRSDVACIGESSLSDLKTRPDFAVAVRNTLIGFIEVKAPGKGADPRRFRNSHDQEQWSKLQSLPNLVYTDGNEFSHWENGELRGSIVRLDGDIETAGSNLSAPPSLMAIFEAFIQWQPIPPRNTKQLAETSARLCRLLRDEVQEQLGLRSTALTALATDWRQLLFPEATDEQFADGYAQAVTFGLLVARAKNITLSSGLNQVAYELTQTNTLIGAALRLLTDDARNQATLATSLTTLVRVLDSVHWPTITKDDPDAWLYFYEDFLGVYDNALRKKTGSYYTPPEVVGSMVRLVNETLRTRFNLHTGLASSTVTIADPAVGTGTFLLGVLRKIAETVEHDEGPGAVRDAIDSAVNRLIGFEIQLGPFAVAQLRIIAELSHLIGSTPSAPPQMFVADTLSDPYGEPGYFPALLAPIGESRQKANDVKRFTPITVVIGNPPYKEKAKGRGSWVESGSKNSPEHAPLEDWIPPPDWGVSAHSKHLRNLYVYFWRWATWKVFDHDPNANTGIVGFITVAGFLNGPGFQRMRDYLRRKADEIWVIDCSPEGHQPQVSTRIFQGVQQPVCIVLASRSAAVDPDVPATVRFCALPSGPRNAKFEALAEIGLDGSEWSECPTDWRAPFLPKSVGQWATFPALDDLFIYNGSGVMPGRTWVIAPDPESLVRRWQTLISAPDHEKEALFHPHISGGGLGDRHIGRVVEDGLPGYEPRPTPLVDEQSFGNRPIRYGFRSFDRQWVIPDNRVINRPNPTLWEVYSERQIYLTAPSDRSPTEGPSLTFTALIPDLHHYNGRGGRVFPLWGDRLALDSNIRPGFLSYLSEAFDAAVTPDDILAYVAAVAAHPAYTTKFETDLAQPGLRIPFTADREIFFDAVEIGRSVIWLHTFGERYVDAANGRPFGSPRLEPDIRPQIPLEGAVPPGSMPDSIDYEEGKRRLMIGEGYVDNVSPQMWAYEVSGKHVVRQWFSYRKKDRSRPIIGDRRPPSKLSNIQPDHWLAEYTTELLNLLNVLGRLIELETPQAELLERVCSNRTISIGEFDSANAFVIPRRKTGKSKRNPSPDQTSMF